MTAGARTQAGLEITSPANPRVKHLVALRHRRSRDRAGVTLVEGFEELGLALAAGARPVSLYVCPALAGPGAQPMIDRVSDLGTEVILVSRAVFGKIAYRESPDGWLAVLPAVRTSLGALRTGANPLVLICEGVEKPGNLGAILRTADAAGVTAVIAADPVTDWRTRTWCGPARGPSSRCPSPPPAPPRCSPGWRSMRWPWWRRPRTATCCSPTPTCPGRRRSRSARKRAGSPPPGWSVPMRGCASRCSGMPTRSTSPR